MGERDRFDGDVERLWGEARGSLLALLRVGFSIHILEKHYTGGKGTRYCDLSTEVLSQIAGLEARVIRLFVLVLQRHRLGLGSVG